MRRFLVASACLEKTSLETLAGDTDLLVRIAPASSESAHPASPSLSFTSSRPLESTSANASTCSWVRRNALVSLEFHRLRGPRPGDLFAVGAST